MLTLQDNELITKTGPGTPMGEYLRRFWIPALLSKEIQEPDCPPGFASGRRRPLLQINRRRSIVESHTIHLGIV